MQNHSRRMAWFQGIAFVAVTAFASVSTWMHLHRPFDADTLAIPVAELTSQAKECAVLVRLLDANQAAPAFAARHARQLSENVARIGDTLGAKHAEPQLEPARASAVQLQAALQAHVQALAVAGSGAQATAASFDALAAGLSTLQSQIKPEH